MFRSQFYTEGHEADLARLQEWDIAIYINWKKQHGTNLKFRILNTFRVKLWISINIFSNPSINVF